MKIGKCDKEHMITWNKQVTKYVVYFAIATFILSALVGGCSSLNRKLGLMDDNVIEESIENVIENKTGISFDLTPGSKE